MIHWVIDTLVNGGITEILVISNNSHGQQVMEYLEDGESHGCAITYGYHREPYGLMKHLQIGRSFANGEDVILMLGDSLFLVTPNFVDAPPGPHAWVARLTHDDISKYAQVKVEGNRVVSWKDKISSSCTGIVQTGAWVLPPDAYDRADRLFRTVEDNEVRLRHLFQEYIDEGSLTASFLPEDSFLDLGTPEALRKGDWLLRVKKHSVAARKVEV